jgi:hypothetical protein
MPTKKRFSKRGGRRWFNFSKKSKNVVENKINKSSARNPLFSNHSKSETSSSSLPDYPVISYKKNPPRQKIFKNNWFGRVSNKFKLPNNTYSNHDINTPAETQGKYNIFARTKKMFTRKKSRSKPEKNPTFSDINDTLTVQPSHTRNPAIQGEYSDSQL